MDNYVLVEFPEDNTYFEDNDIGYPCFNAEDNGARYVPEEEYVAHFKKTPHPNQCYTPVVWPESQNYLGHSDERCEVVLADEKTLRDFGDSTVWVPVNLIRDSRS